MDQNQITPDPISIFFRFLQANTCKLKFESRYLWKTKIH